MKKFIVSLLILLLGSYSVFSQIISINSEIDFRKYFDSKGGEIEPVEGIYNLKIESNVTNINRYSGVQKTTPGSFNTKCIIFKSGSVFRLKILGAPFGRKPENSFLTPTVSPRKFLFTYDENMYQMKSMNLYAEDEATLKCLNKFRIDEGKPVFADISWDFVFTKVFPTIADFNSFKKSTGKVITGTGFAVSSNGNIVTNYHVIENASSIKVKGVGQKFDEGLICKVVSVDRNNDLAILQIIDERFKSIDGIPYTLNNMQADVGGDIFVLGYPMTSTMGEEIKLTTGVISAQSGFQGDISTYQISAPIQPGNSGAPVFDKNGSVIGIANAKHPNAENAGYAIKANYLSNFIQMLQVDTNFESKNPLRGLPLTEQVKAIKRYVYIIEVN